MAPDSDSDQDAITKEEISGTATLGGVSRNGPSKPQERNAFAALMTPQPSQPHPATSTPALQPLGLNPRHSLGPYITSPTSTHPSRIISHTDKFVTIIDLYPKSTIHTLLLPRDASKTLLDPFTALSDPLFLSTILPEVKKLKTLVASELRRKYGRFSAQDAARTAAMDADPPPSELPPGRDWEKEVISGIHAHPSMTHLHIHVLSRDRVSECMKRKKHYNSFNTPFLIDVADFPLAEDDVRRHPGKEGYLDRPLVCWRCGKNFRNGFAKLKRHLEEELEVWKRE